MEITTVGLDLGQERLSGSRDRQHGRSGRPALSKRLRSLGLEQYEPAFRENDRAAQLRTSRAGA